MLEQGPAHNDNTTNLDELLERSAELDTLVRFAPGGIFKYSAEEDEKFSFISENMLKMLGYTREEFARKFDDRFSQMVWHEDRERVLAEINSQVSDSDSDVCDYRIETKSGELMWVNDVGHLVTDSDGKRWFYVVIIDKTAQKRAEEALFHEKHNLEERYASIARMRGSVDKTALGAYNLNLTKDVCGDGHVINDHLRKLSESGTASGFFERMHKMTVQPEQRELCRDVFNREALIAAFNRGDNSISFEHKFLIDADRIAWLRTNIVMAQNPDTDDIEAYIYASNIDVEKTTQQLVAKLIESDYEFAALIDARTGILTLVSEGSDNMLRVPEDGVYYPEAYKASAMTMIAEGEREQCVDSMDFGRVLAELDEHEVYSCSFSTVEGGVNARKLWSFSWLDGARDTVVYTRRDVTDVYRSETDELTGIFNRAGFCRAVRELIASHPDTAFSIIRFDIDHFKLYNDIHGTNAGDELLMAGARALSHYCPPQDAVCGHFRGDHFVVCLPNELVDIIGLRKAVMDALHAERPDFTFVIRCGIYRVNDRDLDVSIMCDRAFMALRSTKGSYSVDQAVYDESMRAEMLETQDIISSMDSALANGEFDVYIQPQYDQTNGKMTGGEALARWFRNGHTVGPDKFIPLFEKNGFIMKFDAYIWERVCQLQRRWLDEGRAVVPVSVNVSRLDIYNPDLRGILKGLLEKYSLTTDHLWLEVTETAYAQDPEQLTEVVDSLRADGFFVEMDDFGSGYSSLNMLNDVNVDMIKLDMRFLSSKGDSGRGGIVINSVVRLARWLNIPVIAEGVERARQADFLKSIGCNLAQGFLYAKPMPPKDFEQLLTEEGTGKASGNVLVTSHFDTDEFWQVESQATVIFNSFVGAACMIEYKGKTAELLRANDKFYAETGSTRDEFASMRGDLMNMVFEDDRYLLRRAIGSAIKTGGESVCETRWNWSRDQGYTVWLRTRMRVVARSAESYIFYVTLENTTERKRMEESLRADDERTRILVTGLKALVFDYDYRNDVLTYEVSKGGGPIRAAITNYIGKLKQQNTKIHPDYIDAYITESREAAKEPCTRTFEYMADFWDEGFKRCLGRHVTIADESGKVCRMVGMVTELE